MAAKAYRFAAMLSSVPELTAEFVGTFLLVFTVGCNVLCETGTFAGVSIACVLMVTIYAFGKISGANFNPAVSFGLGLSKYCGGSGMEWQKVAEYCATQILAGCCAAGCYTVLFGKSFALGPGKGFNLLDAAGAEFLYTMMLVFVVMNVAVSKKLTAGGGNDFYGLAIGFVIIAGAYGAGAISGGCFNPAVSIAINVSSAVSFLHALLVGTVYVAAELSAAAFAVWWFKILRPGDYPEFEAYLQQYDRDHDRDPAVRQQGRIYSAETTGTCFLVITVGLNVLAGSPAGPFSIAACLMSMIYALGDISGAHFNPAVSLAIFISGKLKLPGCAEMGSKELGLRFLYQILGCIIAGGVFTSHHKFQTFPLGPKPGYNWVSVAVAEIVFTMVLCMVVLSVAVSNKTASKQMFGLAIGSCVTVGGFAIGGISGGSLNPAVSFAIGFTDTCGAATSQSGKNALFYIVFEFIGAALAAGLISVTHNDPSTKAEEKSTA